MSQLVKHYNRNIHTGIEAIDFQVKSNLGEKLAQAFEETIVFVNTKIKYNPNNELLNTADQRHTQLTAYCNNVLFPKMISIIESTTRLRITKIIGSDYPTGLFAVDLSMDDAQNMIDMLRMQTGTGEPPKNFTDALRETMEMYKNLDLTTGALSGYKYGKDRLITAFLYFDPFTAFVPLDFYSKDLVTNLTGRELAGIYLHEIGHVLTTVERSHQFYYCVDRYTKHIPEMIKSSSPHEITKALIEYGVPLLNAGKKDKVIDDKTHAVLTKVVDTIQYIDRTAYADEDGDITILGVGVSILAQVFITLTTCMYAVLTNTMFQLLVVGTISGTEAEFANTDSKTSDVMKTRHNLYNMERLADEFVVRHGFGGDVASALQKIMQFFEVLNASSIAAATRLRKSWLYAKFLRFSIFIYRIHGVSLSIQEGVVNNYEIMGNRLRRLAQNQIGIFKQQLTGRDRANAIATYESILVSIDNAERDWDRKAAKIIYTYLLNYQLTPKLAAALLTGRLSNDYEKLQNQIESIVNNKLYYQQAKLQQLADLM